MGREFLPIFDEWAKDYDQSVLGKDEQYREVFEHYDHILHSVSELAIGNVVEFGAGTGNLTLKLLTKGYNVIVVEPSIAMREIAQRKLENQSVSFIDGDFLQFPAFADIDTIVSTFAFHHLNDLEKAMAVKLYGKLLREGGKIVFADTMYESEKAYENSIQEAKDQDFIQLAYDLQTEYYSTIPYLSTIFEKNGFHVSFKRMNKFAWIIEAVKI